MNAANSGFGTMDYMIWTGAALTLVGVIGLVWCIRLAMKARSAGLSGEAMAAVLRRVTVYNLAALAISGIGLMLVVVGVILI